LLSILEDSLQYFPILFAPYGAGGLGNDSVLCLLAGYYRRHAVRRIGNPFVCCRGIHECDKGHLLDKEFIGVVVLVNTRNVQRWNTRRITKEENNVPGLSPRRLARQHENCKYKETTPHFDPST